MKFFIFIFLFCTLVVSAQSPIKSALVTAGNTQEPFISLSKYNFENNYSQSIFVGELNDNRVGNWNKQLNDSIRIEPIRDYWNLPYKTIFKNKLTRELISQKFTLKDTIAKADYTIIPTVDIHFPNFVNFPKQGYWVLTRISMNVLKKEELKMQKAYEDYYFFSKDMPEYKANFSSNYKEGTNVAMWIGMKRVLDKFYKDLDNILVGKPVAKDSISLKVYSIKSNIAKDDALVKEQKSYAKIDEKDKFKTSPNTSNTDNKFDLSTNYKIDSVALPPIVDNNLDAAIQNIPVKKDIANTIVEKAKKVDSIATKVSKVKPKVKEVKTPNAIDTMAKNNPLVAKTPKELEQDSVLKKKELIAKQAKETKEKNLKDAANLAQMQKVKLDSMKKLSLAKQAENLKMKAFKDSILKLEVNKGMELAKKKKEEEKQKQELMAKAKLDKQLAMNKAKAEKLTSIKESSNKEMASNTKYTNEKDIATIMNRISAEVSNEVMKEQKATIPTRTEEIKTDKKSKSKRSLAEETASNPPVAVNRDSFIAKLKERKEKMNKELAQTVPIIKTNYIEDSVKLEMEKQNKRNAIIAAQKAAFELEKNALAKDPDAGKMFASISKDPPSKMPDARSFEQRKVDRIFVPKNVVSKDLLERVKLISPEDEKKLLAKMNTTDPSVIDSIYIEQQKNAPKIEPKISHEIPKQDPKMGAKKDTAHQIKKANTKKELLTSKMDSTKGKLSKTSKKIETTHVDSVAKLVKNSKKIAKSIDTAKSKIDAIPNAMKSKTVKSMDSSKSNLVSKKSIDTVGTKKASLISQTIEQNKKKAEQKMEQKTNQVKSKVVDSVQLRKDIMMKELGLGK